MAVEDSSHELGSPIFITLWDLLPPSSIASAAYRIAGLGVLHTNVWCPDLSTEWAYGGHEVPGVTGVFSLPTTEFAPPSGLSLLPSSEIPAPGPAPLPGARYKGAYFLGYAGEPAAVADSSPSSSRTSVRPSSTGRWAAPQTGRSAFTELGVGRRQTQGWFGGMWGSAPPKEAFEATQEGKQHPRHRGVRAKSCAFILRTIAEFKKDPEWQGPSYDLLNRNCNHFTAALVLALTGATLPGFINRTASIGSVIVPLLPASLTGLAELDTSAHACTDADYDANSADGYEHEDRPLRTAALAAGETQLLALKKAAKAEAHAGDAALGSMEERAEAAALFEEHGRKRYEDAMERARLLRQEQKAKV